MAEPVTCPVAEIGHEVEALWAAFMAKDSRVVALKKGVEHDQLELENEHIVDRRDALEELAACTQARSPVGAMFQIILARAATEAAMSYLDTRWEKQGARYSRQIEACLYSVLRVLEELSGVPAEQVGANHYMCRKYDPHPALAAAVAGQPIPPALDRNGDE